jgi:hypothetical protein
MTIKVGSWTASGISFVFKERRTPRFVKKVKMFLSIRYNTWNFLRVTKCYSLDARCYMAVRLEICSERRSGKPFVWKDKYSFQPYALTRRERCARFHSQFCM